MRPVPDDVKRFLDRFANKPYKWFDDDLGTQADYVLAGDKDAPEGFPVTPTVMK
jgi:hypothetical protein